MKIIQLFKQNTTNLLEYSFEVLKKQNFLYYNFFIEIGIEFAFKKQNSLEIIRTEFKRSFIN